MLKNLIVWEAEPGLSYLLPKEWYLESLMKVLESEGIRQVVSE
jgi:hypothetical protein